MLVDGVERDEQDGEAIEAQGRLIVDAMRNLDKKEPQNANNHDLWGKVMPEVERIKAERGL